MRVPHNAVVVVADGRKMLFFRNEGDAEYPNLQVEKKRVDVNPADHEQAADLAGRAMGTRTSGGAWGSSNVENTDFHQLEEDRFAAETAELLKERALRNEFESLIIVAPPKTLGELRKHYHKEVSDRISAEIDKDLTKHPVSEIEAALAKAE
ncbi:host attachment family protein [Sphingomonas sp. G-3-2-10]|jgi:protein required for attachment to host cells|uniref:host attachment family protein n=1 Tax=Sphingomonas sp. G-3-2-10 TaxID=2728838 RepID=UPI00146C6230|nr:host attachment family protein [Sphingomonas sp. G-3-2-10]NML04771.1 host attachment protein [Sphingomonas sp. G-3-2-10]